MNDDDDVRVAARALLTGRYVTGSAAILVRRHRRVLAQLFHDELGWSLTAEDHGPVRALCQPGAAHVARGLTKRSGRPLAPTSQFDPTRYALTFLVLAALEIAGARTTLTLLFDSVRDRARSIEDLEFDHNQAASRRAFVHAVQATVDLGVLEWADGDENAFAANGQGDALYKVDRGRLNWLLATSKPPSLAADAAAATVESRYTDTDDGHLRHRRHRVTRALVSETIVYREDLTEAEAQYLTSQEPRLRRLLATRFGLTLETRAEGWVAVDDEGSGHGPTAALTDVRFPDISVSCAAALAIVDGSPSRRTADATAAWTVEDLEEFVAGLGDRFGASWTLDPGDGDAVTKVTAEAVNVLVALRLALRGPPPDSSVVVLPAAGRFAVSEPAADAELTLPTGAP